MTHMSLLKIMNKYGDKKYLRDLNFD